MWVLFGLFFMFSNFYRLDFHDETCIALANLQESIIKNWIQNETFLNFVDKVIGSACLLIL